VPFLGSENLYEQGFEIFLLQNEAESGVLDTTTGQYFPMEYSAQRKLPVLKQDPFVNNICLFSEDADVEMELEADMVCPPAPVKEKNVLRESQIWGSVFGGPMRPDGDGTGHVFVSSATSTKPIISKKHIKVSRRRFHERICHWSIPGLKCSCQACTLAKGVRKGHDKVRRIRQDYKPLKTLASDFATGFPTSIRGNRVLLVTVCDAIKHCWIRPLEFKADVIEEVESIIRKIRQDYSIDLNEKLVYFFRSDNEAVFRSKDFDQMLQTLQVSPSPTVAHNSEMNGTTERFIRSMCGSIRSMLYAVDHRVWCYAGEYAGAVWNILPHDYAKLPELNGQSPQEILDKRVDRGASKHDIGALRVFGCLCYGRDEQTIETKLSARWRRSIFLGFCSSSSGYLLGSYVADGRCTSGYMWKTYSTRDVRFREDIPITNLDWLHPSSKGVFLRCDPLASLANGAEDEVVDSAQTSRRAHGLDEDASATLHDVPGDGTRSERDSVVSKQTHKSSGHNPILPIRSMDPFPEFSHSVQQDDLDGNLRVEVEEGNEILHPISNPNHSYVKMKRGRGRPKGSKNKKKPKNVVPPQEHIALLSTVIGGDDWEDGETYLECHAYLSVAQALKSPDATLWKAALDKEHARLLMYETWIPATDVHLAESKMILPIAVVLTIKRDGTYKARACVLGNLDRAGNIETFAPVVSQSAVRLILTEAAADGDEVLPYDLDSAFLNAELDRNVLCRLPPVWADSHGNSVFKLKKALYGLKDAPRLWYKKYGGILRELGWIECSHTPGLWKKPSVAYPDRMLKMSVYVDDNLICGPDGKELQSELDAIFKHVKGRIIPSEQYKMDGISWTFFDFLGMDIHYSGQGQAMRISMKTYIEKMCKKFSVKLGTRILTPNFDESALDAGGSKDVPDYPIRSVIGAVQWVATCGRPDVSVPVAALARYASKTPTVNIARACRKVMKYLLSTVDEGIEYSVQREQDFSTIYSKLLPDGRDLPLLNVFSDAGFANNIKCLHSTSGSIGYWRGVPIYWRSQRQGVRAYSTAESEYIACSDTLVVSEHNDFLSFFQRLPSKLVQTSYGVSPSVEDAIVWVDNESAIATAKSTDSKPRSRHYALRYVRVREAAGKIVFCPTHLMKADGLSKVSCSKPQRDMLLHHIENPRVKGREPEEEEYVDDVYMCYSDVYSPYFGF